jgi:predicted RNA-binding Zn ribbon-like protein
MTPPSLKFIAGDPALDLVNSADWTAAGPTAERLPDYARWVEWAQASGIVGARAAAQLRTAARRDPAAAGRALGRVLAARGLLQRVLTARARGVPPRTAELRDFNGLLRQALARLELTPRGHGVALTWRGLDAELDAALSPVLWAAARLLDSADAERIRVCDGPDCGWMYLDRSRNGLRRWCEMSTCGTREKNRRRAIAT